MNSKTGKGVILAMVAGALLARVSLADETAQTDDEAETRIVLAKAASTDTSRVETANEEDSDESVAEALESISTDNKIELDMRLSSHTSELLLANR